MGSKFCLKFHRAPLKFHTKFWTHTPQNMLFTVFIFCVWVSGYLWIVTSHALVRRAPGPLLTSFMVKACMINYIHVKQWNVITFPCHYLNSGLVQLLFEFFTQKWCLRIKQDMHSFHMRGNSPIYSPFVWRIYLPGRWFRHIDGDTRYWPVSLGIFGFSIWRNAS